MTERELIRRLAEDQEITLARAEDIVAALTDLCLDVMQKGEPFHLGELGFLAVNPRLSRNGKGVRAAITFQASKKTRKRLSLPAEPSPSRQPGICGRCGLRPKKVFIYQECDACQHARKRARSKEQGAKEGRK